MNNITKNVANTALSKVPELTLIFWIIKILATTLGETAGDALSMSMNLGYLVSTAIFATLFFVAVLAQVKPNNSTLFCIGQPLLQPPQLAPRWPIMPIARLALAIQAALRCC